MAEPVPFDRIAKTAAFSFGVRLADLTAPGRERRAARARFCVVLLARRLRHDLSFTWLGAQLGGRDFSTMCHAYRRAEALFASDPDFRRRVESSSRLFGFAALPPRRTGGQHMCGLERAIAACERRLAYLRAQREDLMAVR